MEEWVQPNPRGKVPAQDLVFQSEQTLYQRLGPYSLSAMELS